MTDTFGRNPLRSGPRRPVGGVLPVVFSLFLSLPWRGAAADTPASPGRLLSFPADHASHDDFQTEWWYTTGHLYTAGARPFEAAPSYGFQLTFFRRRSSEGEGWGQSYLAHAALTDLAGGKFLHDERLDRSGIGTSGASSRHLDVWNGDWRAVVVGDRHVFDFDVPGGQGAARVRVRLVAAETTPPLLHGDKGYSRKGRCPTCASHYYSLPRLSVSGHVDDGKAVTPVTGLAWTDHEFMSDSLDKGQVGWDWTCLVFRDGTDLMLYSLRGSVPDAGHRSGTLRRPDGAVVPLGADDFVFRPVARWKSPRSGAVYPSAWEIAVPSAGISEVVRPLAADQEMTTAAGGAETVYWEGASRADSGRAIGYVELTGYAKSLGERL